MKLIKLIFLFSFFSIALSYGQFSQKNITKGTKFYTSAKSTSPKYIGADAKNTYAFSLKKSGSRVILYRFNSKMTTKENEIKLKGSANEGIEVILLNDKLYLVAKKYERKSKKYEYYIQEINKSSLQLTGSQKVMAKKDRKKPISTYVTKSKDATKAVLALVTEPEPFRTIKDTEKREFQFVVFDKNLKVLWEKAVKLAKTPVSIDIEEFKISNNGDVFVSTTNYKTKSKGSKKRKLFKRDVEHFKKIVLQYTQDDDEAVVFEFRNGQKQTTSFAFDITENSILGVGYYGETTRGIFFLEYRLSDQEIIREDVAPVKKLGEKTIIKYILVNDNGELFVIGSEEWLESKSSAISNYSSLIIIAKSILVTFIAKDGNIEWTKVMANNQEGYAEDHKLSVGAAVIGNNAYILFNNHYKNFGNKGDKKLQTYPGFSKSNMLSTIVKIAPDGEIEAKKLFARDDVHIFPETVKKINGKIYAVGMKSHGIIPFNVKL